jgi:hypothetical protein
LWTVKENDSLLPDGVTEIHQLHAQDDPDEENPEEAEASDSEREPDDFSDPSVAGMV